MAEEEAFFVSAGSRPDEFSAHKDYPEMILDDQTITGRSKIVTE
jgi:hypothetical protein